jgi:hypothetical protein
VKVGVRGEIPMRSPDVSIMKKAKAEEVEGWEAASTMSTFEFLGEIGRFQNQSKFQRDGNGKEMRNVKIPMFSTSAMEFLAHVSSELEMQEAHTMVGADLPSARLSPAVGSGPEKELDVKEGEESTDLQRHKKTQRNSGFGNCDLQLGQSILNSDESLWDSAHLGTGKEAYTRRSKDKVDETEEGLLPVPVVSGKTRLRDAVSSLDVRDPESKKHEESATSHGTIPGLEDTSSDCLASSDSDCVFCTHIPCPYHDPALDLGFASPATCCSEGNADGYKRKAKGGIDGVVGAAAATLSWPGCCVLRSGIGAESSADNHLAEMEP